MACDGIMQACFRKEWAQLVEASFRNFLAEAIEQLPLPAVLRFDADRRQRLELQEQCRSLQKHNAQLKQARGALWEPCSRRYLFLVSEEIHSPKKAC